MLTLYIVKQLYYIANTANIYTVRHLLKTSKYFSQTRIHRTSKLYPDISHYGNDTYRLFHVKILKRDLNTDIRTGSAYSVVK